MNLKTEIIINHVNTETKTFEIEDNNDKIAWIVLKKKDGTKQLFFPQHGNNIEKRVGDL